MASKMHLTRISFFFYTCQMLECIFQRARQQWQGNEAQFHLIKCLIHLSYTFKLKILRQKTSFYEGFILEKTHLVFMLSSFMLFPSPCMCAHQPAFQIRSWRPSSQLQLMLTQSDFMLEIREREQSNASAAIFFSKCECCPSFLYFSSPKSNLCSISLDCVPGLNIHFHGESLQNLVECIKVGFWALCCLSFLLLIFNPKDALVCRRYKVLLPMLM